jgi:hypothetical protein
MGWFSFKKAEPVGDWVEDMEYVDGKIQLLGTYTWVGPEPPNGRPENPGETPEGIAEREEILQNMAKEKRRAAKRAQENMAYMKMVAKRNAAKYGMVGGRKTKKNRKRSQKKRKSCRH